LDQYFVLGGELEDINWRTYIPSNFCEKINSYVMKRLS